MWTEVKGSVNEYSEIEMRAAFEAVQDSENWKNPIPEVFVSATKLCVVVAAIAFFTGGVAYIQPCGDGFLVKAPGYYLSVGA